MKAWLVGKKTYIAAVLFALMVVVLIFLGKLTPKVAIDLALLGLPLFASTLRSALAGHQLQAVKILTDVAEAGEAYRRHDATGVLTAVERIATDALSPAALSVTFAGPTSDVLHAVNAVRIPQTAEAANVVPHA